MAVTSPGRWPSSYSLGPWAFQLPGTGVYDSSLSSNEEIIIRNRISHADWTPNDQDLRVPSRPLRAPRRPVWQVFKFLMSPSCDWTEVPKMTNSVSFTLSRGATHVTS